MELVDPSHTNNIARNDSLQGSEEDIGRALQSKVNMPEVVVTRPSLKSLLSRTSSSGRKDEEEGSALGDDNSSLHNSEGGFESRKMSLLSSILPPPTSTRFIGRMHASLHKSSEAAVGGSSSSLSRKTSLSSEMIKEDMDETEEGEAAPPTKAKGKVFPDFNSGVPTSTRFVGRLSKRIQDKNAGNESPARSMSRTGSNRKTIWKKVGQNSFDQGPGRKKGPSPGGKLRRKVNKQSPFASGSTSPSHASDPEELLTKMMVSLGINLLDSASPTEAGGTKEGNSEQNEFWDLIQTANESNDFGENASLKNLEVLISSSIEANKGPETSSSKMGLPEMILRGMPTSSRFVGKLQSKRQLARSLTLKSNNEDSDEEISNAKRHPGLPTSFRYIGKSISVLSSVSRGPNNILIENPPPGQKPDFSHTANMLSFLAKIDIKMKQRVGKEGGGHEKLSTSGGGKHRASSRASGSRITAEGSSQTGTSTNNEEVDGRISLDEIRKLEKDDNVKALFDNLKRVRHCSIPNWNLHRHIKEDKKRNPYVIQLDTKTEPEPITDFETSGRMHF